MGNASTICCDKTGTLTTNRMTVVRVFVNNTDFPEPKHVRQLPAALVDVIAMSAALNSQTKLLYVQRPDELPSQQGNKVERTLCMYWFYS
jgi:Ca2+ transporting ATPase